MYYKMRIINCGNHQQLTTKAIHILRQYVMLAIHLPPILGKINIVWVIMTGEEAFLECVKTVSSSKKRTSAGFWGFGQWPAKYQHCLLKMAA